MEKVLEAIEVYIISLRLSVKTALTSLSKRLYVQL